MPANIDIKILFIDTGFLTLLYNKERINFRWDDFVEGASHPFDMVVAYVPAPETKHKFVTYINSRDVLTNDAGILMTEFLLQTHIRATELHGRRYDYTIIGHDPRLVKVLHPLLDIQHNDVIKLHHAHERSEVQQWIDGAPKNVYWHGIDCMKKYFDEVK